VAYLVDWWGSGSVGPAQDTGVDVDVRVAAAPGVSVLGGRSLGIAAAAANKGTAADFVLSLSSAEVQRSLAEQGWSSPALTDLYTDADLLRKAPTLKVVAEALKTARPLPVSTHSRELAQVIDDAVRPALTGARTPTEALNDVQNRLEQLLK
jgi:maltose-binding protein MalE